MFGQFALDLICVCERLFRLLRLHQELVPSAFVDLASSLESFPHTVRVFTLFAGELGLDGAPCETWKHLGYHLKVCTKRLEGLVEFLCEDIVPTSALARQKELIREALVVFHEATGCETCSDILVFCDNHFVDDAVCVTLSIDYPRVRY